VSLQFYLRSLSSRLEELERGGLRRYLRYFGKRTGTTIHGEGRTLVNFSSNDYLGLSQHPLCIEGAARALRDFGCGSGGSRVVTGGVSPALELEDALGTWMGQMSCLIFPSGYQANLGAISALAGPADLIFSDAHNHASLIDGCRLSGAQVSIYPHGDVLALASQLASLEPDQGQRFIVTDTLFSMDGTLAPIGDIAELCKQFDAFLVVDEAHSLGVLGPEGRGVCASFARSPDLLIGTLSKAAGSLGAFAISQPVVADWLVQRARSFIYTTFLPPSVLAASLAAVCIIQSPEGDVLRSRVICLADRLRRVLSNHGFRASGAGTPIVALSFPGTMAAGLISADLQAEGFLVWAFRPPTVPEGNSLLRVSISAGHTDSQVYDLGVALVDSVKRCADLYDQTKGYSP
jgi:8-amino-7-oxononanoate synthase